MVDVGESLTVVGDSLDIQAAETVLLLLCCTAELRCRTIETVVYSMMTCIVKEVTDGNGDNEHRPSVTPSAIKELISEMYPGATILEIDTEAKGTEVDILHENIHKEVWLDTQNKWLYTEWEIRSSQVPDIVMTAFKASAYASYQIDDIHVIQKAEGLSYEFELEQGDRDITILFNEEGILVSPTH